MHWSAQTTLQQQPNQPFTPNIHFILKFLPSKMYVINHNEKQL